MDEIKNLPENRDLVFTTICCALWGIWKMRNRVVFEGRNPEPKVTLIQISRTVQDYMPIT